MVYLTVGHVELVRRQVPRDGQIARIGIDLPGDEHAIG